VNALYIPFLVVFGAHVAFSLLTMGQDPKELRKNRPLSAIHLLIQFPLFYLACYFGVREGVFSRQLISPAYIALGLLAGHLIFGISLLITHRSLEDSRSLFFDFGALWDFAMDSPFVLTRFLAVAFAEEIIYRVAAQSVLLDLLPYPPLAILIVAACFVAVHPHFFKNGIAVGAEFVGFAILLGVLYYFTRSFILVIVIHALRDIEIAYIEYLIRVEELGDEELAAEELEQTYSRKHPERA
jgi:membrane protease YdiL (CAAX protease family)